MLTLPWPPSTNAIWRSYRGRVVRSAAYKSWQVRAGKEIMVQRPGRHKGPVSVHIELASPTKRAFDIDNRVKPILDLLVDMQIIEGDDNAIIQQISVCRGQGFVGVRVEVVSS